MHIYTGYVYLWYDTKAKFFYVGGHFGKASDSYVCSSKTMKRAFVKRPKTFKFRILEYTYGDTADLRNAEQRWLNKIKDTELMLSENVLNGKCRYYNVKKFSCGGNGKGTNKGKSHVAWNKGLTKEMRDLRKLGLFSLLTDKPKKTIKQIAIKSIPKIKKEKLIRFGTCIKCEETFCLKKKKQKFCSKSCSCSYAASFSPSANNGRKGATKQIPIATGRKKKIISGSNNWCWEKCRGGEPPSVSRLPASPTS